MRHVSTRAVGGDKSPVHSYSLPLIDETLPEARIVHIIRDGRDVAVSLREVWFAPSQNAGELAAYWARTVTAAREGGRRCRHYMEVRYQELPASPRRVLAQVCEFIDLAFEESMLDYHHGARQRLSEATGRVLPDGRVITLEDRLAQQRLTSSPPDLTRIERWRHGLSSEDLSAFEARAGWLLRELGYRLSSA